MSAVCSPKQNASFTKDLSLTKKKQQKNPERGGIWQKPHKYRVFFKFV